MGAWAGHPEFYRPGRLGRQVSIPLEPVPITLQVLVVLLAGLSLGPRDGALSLLLYLGAIASGLPLAANGMGSAALAGPTAGYLIAFPAAAWLTGWLAQNQRLLVRGLAAVLGVGLIYLVGASYLKVYLGTDWSMAWQLGVAPFLVLDLAKAALATVGGEGARRFWLGRLRDER
ncbi:MAG: biotin transporter BioY [Anaerolineae bacterium]|nr:biotin transporter BioY [Anaerolineae bacterium]